MGTLITFTYNLNDPRIVNDLLERIGNHMSVSRETYHELVFSPSYYFSIPDGPITTEAGWHIILDGKTPLYVGTSADLNARLNTPNGSSETLRVLLGSKTANAISSKNSLRLV